MQLHKKIQTVFSFSSTDFKSKSLSELQLCILIDADKFQYAIMSDSKQMMHICTYQIQSEADLFIDYYRQIFLSDPLLKNNYKKAVVFAGGENFTLIPSNFFVESELQNLVTIHGISQVKNTIYNSEITSINQTNTFSLNQQLVELFQNQFQNIEFKNLNDALISSLIHQEGKLHLCISSSHFELLLFADHRLNYINTFKYNNADDLLYYTLFVMKQLGLDPENFPIQIFGDLLPDSSIYKLLTKYVRNISFGKKPDGLQFSEEIKLLPHFHFQLYIVQVCQHDRISDLKYLSSLQQLNFYINYLLYNLYNLLYKNMKMA